ncbi:substrate-binding periplasmic protein [Pseudobacteriovorax antillogorgiicola]|uniref:Polar amino acid transport system substrate-binding protein n=1 Tax=Pseudobacteriovorax antillogorgiicola TaxID=1513793 RepID=A0A1Y6BGH8_9BACT|nr:transporter substrate-binding domain-containing protein [Pseudobacteriovorax antillogorgiicola]TCS56252.1 polar amino acid transport system substrate-binding protein [Pseudobacteriovorax antillogorgiicola]SMF07984.1 polar amino acid transport system substrate-binding protein [Pseudobacteriovorax antillogorgiicola]
MMVEGTDKGKFIDLTKKAFSEAGIDVEINILPPPQAIASFNEKKYDVLFPALDVNFPDLKKVSVSETIYMKKDFVFTQKGKPLLRTVQDLIGKTVGLTQGYPYDPAVTSNKQINLRYQKSDFVNVKDLNVGKIDAFIVEENTGLNAFERFRSKNYQYDNASPISEQNVYYAFQQSLEDKQKLVTKAIKDLKISGYFAKIFGNGA